MNNFKLSNNSNLIRYILKNKLKQKENGIVLELY